MSTSGLLPKTSITGSDAGALASRSARRFSALLARSGSLLGAVVLATAVLGVVASPTASATTTGAMAFLTPGCSSWTPAASGQYQVEAIGAMGSPSFSIHGGFGGEVTGVITFTDGVAATVCVDYGGGAGGTGDTYGSDGGGASSVSSAGIMMLVAGGGGGAAPLNADGGNAGYPDGANGAAGDGSGGTATQGTTGVGQGGSATSGGAGGGGSAGPGMPSADGEPGSGGVGSAQTTSVYGGGGGGGGYFGGGGGAPDLGGGGGSDYCAVSVSSCTTSVNEETSFPTGTTRGAEVVITPLPTTTATVPGTPTGLVAKPGDGQVALSWSAPSDGGSPIVNYAVYEGTASGKESATPVKEPTTTSTTVSGLTNGTQYFFTVAAVNTVGTSAPSDQVSATPTVSCGPGFYQAEAGSGDCQPAPPGSFVAVAGATTPTACPTGTYQPLSGQSSCVAAQPGSYVDTTGATSSTPCPAGSSLASSQGTTCLAAPPGSYVPIVGATAPTPCLAGEYQPASGQTTCLAAPPGTYVDLQTTSAALCGAGTYQPASGQASCIPAPPGSYVDVEGATLPSRCGAGTYQPASGQSSCLIAPAGSYAPVSGAIAAVACPIGQYQPDVGQSSCLPAPAGTFVDTEGAVSATACPSGTTSVAGASSCETVVTVTAADVTVAYGASSPPAVTATFSGFPAGETASSLTQAPVCSSSWTASTAPGTYPGVTSCTGAEGSGLVFVYVSGSLTVTAASQHIRFTSSAPADATVDGPAYTAEAVASSGLVVTVASTTPAVCTVSGATVHFGGAGTCTIVASQAGDRDYTPASASQSFAVHRLPITVAVSGSQPYGASSATFTDTVTGPGGVALPSGVTVSGAVVCTTVGTATSIGPALAPGTYTVLGSSCSGLSLSDGADFAVSYTGATDGFSVTAAPTTLTVHPVTAAPSRRGLDADFSATLTSTATESAAASQSVTFTLSDGKALCTATTDASGVATCAVPAVDLVAFLFDPGYTATFSGSPDYLASRASGSFFFFGFARSSFAIPIRG